MNAEKYGDLSDSLNPLKKYFSTHIIESSSLIRQIKQSLYTIMNFNMRISPSIERADSLTLILQAAHRNIGDLKRIDSLLRGLNQQKQVQNIQQEGLNLVNTSVLQKIKDKKLEGIQITSQLLVGNGVGKNKQQSVQQLQVESKVNPSVSELFSEKTQTYKSSQRLVIKELEIQVKYLRDENQTLKLKINEINHDIGLKGKSPMLFSFGKPSDSMIGQETNTISHRQSPSIYKYRQQFKQSSSQIKFASMRNQQCLDLLRVIKNRLDKADHKKKPSFKEDDSPRKPKKKPQAKDINKKDLKL